jgi:hypothetical protein
MKGAAPIKRPRHSKIMPFNGDTHRIDVAIKRSPAVFHLAPGVPFGRALRTHRAKLRMLPRGMQGRFLLLEGRAVPVTQLRSCVIGALSEL